MRGRPYYEEPEYHDYLLSRERKDLFPPDHLLGQVDFAGVEELLDFGIGPGYFLQPLLRHAGPGARVWGVECQEVLIDACLRTKVKEDLEERFIPFFIERTEHPLLPDWIPYMDLIFCSCVLSTFADPTLALQGIGRACKSDGRIIVLDWEKVEAPSGPEIGQKISADRMSFFVEDAGYNIDRRLRAGEYLYMFELSKTEAARERDERERFQTLDYDSE